MHFLSHDQPAPRTLRHSPNPVATTKHNEDSLMDQRQIREFATIQQSRAFLHKHKLESGPFRVIAKNLDGVIKRVWNFAAEARLAAAPSSSVPMRQLTDDLRLTHMLPLSRRGKTLFRGEVNIENALRVPHATARPAIVLAAARAMAKAIQPHRKLFIEAGASQTFLTDLRTASEKLAAFVKVADQRLTKSPATFRGLREQIKRGRQEISVADGQVIAWLRTMPAGERSVLEAQWRTARRIRARIGRPTKRGKGPAAESASDGSGDVGATTAPIPNDSSDVKTGNR